MREKLINICTPRQWKTLSKAELKDEGYTVYGANGVIGYYDEYNHEVETVMIGCRGTCGTVNISKPYSYINGNAMCMDDLRQDIDVKYLYYTLKHYDFREVISGSSQPQITRQGLKNVFVEVVDKSRQLEIVKVLSNVEETISRKQQQLSEYDQLIKSRFVEMFGDIRSNSRALTSKSGKDLFKFSSGKFLSEDKRYNSGIPVYGGNGIAWYTDNPIIKHSTLIIGRVGAYCGNVQLVEEPVWITDNAIYIKEFYDDSFNLDFLFEMMKIIDFSRFADYSGQPKITQKPLKDMQYLIPKRQEQEDFSLFVKQVEKLKFAVQQSLNETQQLFDSLMQEYFG